MSREKKRHPNYNWKSIVGGITQERLRESSMLSMVRYSAPLPLEALRMCSLSFLTLSQPRVDEKKWYQKQPLTTCANPHMEHQVFQPGSDNEGWEPALSSL